MSSTARALVLSVRTYDGRYHGVAEWPPAPGRLFQALVAGVGPRRTEAEDRALRWLERLPPPVVAAPIATRGQEVRWFVPNNDLDAMGGDPARIPEIRTLKRVHPRIFDASVPFVYAWTYTADDEAIAEEACRVAEKLYQLGRGIDPAWAVAERLDVATCAARLASYPGQVFRPAPGAPDAEVVLTVSGEQTLASLDRRHAATLHKLRWEGGRNPSQVFAQPPKPVFTPVPYASPPARVLYDVRSSADPTRFAPRALAAAARFVERVRDAAAERLRQALDERAADVERAIVGRPVDGVAIPPERRVRILPLPSIGHEHVDRGIRRVLVEVPPDAPLGAADVHWAFSALEVDGAVLVRAEEHGMLGWYGVSRRARRTRWRTVTPAALPEVAARRRVDPARQRDEAKPTGERLGEELRARDAVVQALRHAGVPGRPASIRVQREPFDRRGLRAEVFAEGTRFRKERLWHVELELDRPIAGPLVIGDGRFLGLGLLAPEPTELFAFAVEDGLIGHADPEGVARALRRAVMARAQQVVGDRTRLPTWFTGHAEDGGPDASGRHLAFVFDPEDQRLLVLPPHLAQRRAPSLEEQRHLDVLEAALDGLRELRAGSAGVLRLRRIAVDIDADPLFAPSTHWASAAAYRVDRHRKGIGADEALAADLVEACRREGLPVPAVRVHRATGVRGRGLEGWALLEFAVPVRGPMLLGRSRHQGGGLFRGVTPVREER